MQAKLAETSLEKYESELSYFLTCFSKGRFLLYFFVGSSF